MAPLRVALPWHGRAAIVCWLIHGGHHVLRGTAHDLLWACNVAVPMLAIGCLLGARLPCAIAVLWLSFGTPIWLTDLVTGANLIWTSVLVHVVAPAVGVSAIYRLGWPPRSWIAGAGASALLLMFTRFVGEPDSNVNLVFRVHDGWEERFHSHAVFVALLFGVSTLIFFGLDLAARRLFRGRGGS